MEIRYNARTNTRKPVIAHTATWEVLFQQHKSFDIQIAITKVVKSLSKQMPELYHIHKYAKHGETIQRIKIEIISVPIKIAPLFSRHTQVVGPRQTEITYLIEDTLDSAPIIFLWR